MGDARTTLMCYGPILPDDLYVFVDGINKFTAEMSL